MKLTFLGTGGSQPIPLPCCECDLCLEARERGAPYTRCGYSMYLHELNAMIDASGFAAWNLNRWRIPRVDYLFLTHWHPDHANGIGVLSLRDPPKRDDETFLEAKRRNPPTVVTTRAVYQRTCDVLGSLEFLVEERGWVDVHFLDEEPFSTNGVVVEPVPYPLEEGGPRTATGFVFERDGTTLTVVADDSRYVSESRLPDDVDTAVFECGHFTHGPDGDRIRSESLDTDDLSHEEVCDRIGRLAPERAVLSHISHHYGRSYDDFRELERSYDRTRFAHDGMTIEI